MSCLKAKYELPSGDHDSLSEAPRRIDPNLRSPEPKKNTLTKRRRLSSERDKQYHLVLGERDREVIGHTAPLKELAEGLVNGKISGDKSLTIS